jgi:hypothetical protein
MQQIAPAERRGLFVGLNETPLDINYAHSFKRPMQVPEQGDDAEDLWYKACVNLQEVAEVTVDARYGYDQKQSLLRKMVLASTVM